MKFLLFFLIIMIMSGIGGMSVSSWFGCWFVMELSTFFFYPLFLSEVGSEKQFLLTKSLWKFFFFQSMLSLLLFFTLIIYESHIYPSLFLLLCLVCILSKMGAFPVHGLGFHLVEMMPWKQLLIFSTVLKIPPLALMHYVGESLDPVVLGFSSVFVSVMMVSYLLFNTSLKWFFMASSSYLVGWLTISFSLSKSESLFFMLSYFLTLTMAIFSISVLDKSEMGMFSFKETSLWEKKVMTLFILFLMGTPPGVVFLSKVSVISMLLNNGWTIVSVSLLLTSAAAAVMYMKVSLSSLLSKESFLLQNNGWIISSKGLLFVSITLSIGVFVCFIC